MLEWRPNFIEIFYWFLCIRVHAAGIVFHHDEQLYGVSIILCKCSDYMQWQFSNPSRPLLEIIFSLFYERFPSGENGNQTAYQDTGSNGVNMNGTVYCQITSARRRQQPRFS